MGRPENLEFQRNRESRDCRSLGTCRILGIGLSGNLSEMLKAHALRRPFQQSGDESVGVEFKQDLSAAIGFQGTIDRLLELVEGIHMLDGRGQ